MEDLKYMSSRCNSLDGVKEKYKKGIIETFEYICSNKEKIKQDGENRGLFGIEGFKRVVQSTFNNMQYKECADKSLGSNDRWGIVSKKNFFGIEAVTFPDKAYMPGEKLSKNKRLFLQANAGRFQPQKFDMYLFPNLINISDILNREEQEQFSEIETFYNMNNREVFEKFGVHASGNNEKMLIANSVLLDSLLKDSYSDVKSIWCGRFENYYNIKIDMNDGTKIEAGGLDSEKGIAIEKGGKTGIVQYNILNKEDNSELKNINDLEICNVVYSGDDELIEELKKAMAEQFKSQRNTERLSNGDVLEVLSELGRYGIKQQAEQKMDTSLDKSIEKIEEK